MADVDDRWHRADKATGQKVRTAQYGQGMRWDARWRDETGKQRHKRFERQVDAERFLSTVVADLSRGSYIDPNAGKVKLRAFAEQWLAGRNFAESTREAVDQRLRLHVLPYLGDVELRAMRPSTVQSWTRKLRDHLAVSTVQLCFVHLSSIMTAAVDDGLILSNPCRSKSAKPPRPQQGKVVPWTGEQLDAVREALPARYRAIVDAGSGCGLRQGEIFGLAVDDVDWMRNVIHVRRQIKHVGGKKVFAPPKGGKERDVPLAEVIKLRLAAQLAAFPACTETLPWEVPAGRPVTVKLMFSSSNGSIHRSSFNPAVWKPALVKAGVIAPRPVGERHTPSREHGMHALRHYYASAMLHNGVSVKELAEYIGHSDAATTLRIYTHLMPASEDRARAAIEKAFASAEDISCAPDVRRAAGGEASTLVNVRSIQNRKD